MHAPTPRSSRALFVLLLAAAALAPGAREARGAAPKEPAPLTVEDLARLRLVTEATLSHDGRTAAWALEVPRTAAEKNGPAWKHLVVQPLGGRPARAFVRGEVRIEAPAFSPDDRLIGFLTKRGGQEDVQLWAIPVDGGEARPLTDHPGGVAAFAWLPDGARVVYVAAETPTTREEALADKGYAPRVFEEVDRQRALWLAPVDFDGEPAQGRRLTGDLSVWQLDVAPTGGVVALGVSQRPRVDDEYMRQDVHVLTLPGGVPAADAPPVATRLVADPPGKLGNLRLSPDGRHIAYTAAATLSDHAPSRVYVVPVAGGAPRDLTPPDFEGHAMEATWADADTVLYGSEEGVWTTWSLAPLAAPAGSRTVAYHARDTGVVAELPVVRPGAATALFIGSAPTHPREVFVAPAPSAAAPGAAPTRLTDSNPWLAERALGRQEVVRYQARDGLAIEGILIHPATPPKRGRAPLVVHVHGGPESSVWNGWVTGYFYPGQLAAGRGWASFYPNYRGSTGRGAAFAAAAYGDPAGAEFDDIADGIRHLTGPDGPFDPERVGLVGASYGGYAANWFATKYSALVRAVVSFVGVSDLVAKRLLTDIPFEDEAVHMGAPVREQWALMLERSPIRHAAAAGQTAVLLLHGDSDPRVHPSQSQELYRALKATGHPAVRLVFYPGEGHGNRLRSYRLDTALRTMEWLEWYVEGGKPLDGALPPHDLGDRYGLELPAADDGEGGAAERGKGGGAERRGKGDAPSR